MSVNRHRVSFDLIKRVRDYSTFPCTTSYTAEKVVGLVVNIRDLTVDNLHMGTVEKDPL
jgi:hypothetical protein